MLDIIALAVIAASAVRTVVVGRRSSREMKKISADLDAIAKQLDRWDREGP